MSHTTEPWHFEAGSNDDCGMLVGKYGVVCDFVDDPKPEDARRIVACVNACEGIETERLERMVQLTPMLFAEWLTTPDPLYDKVVQQRDELLAAARAVLALEERMENGERILFYGEFYQAYEELRSAIAKAEGKQ